MAERSPIFSAKIDNQKIGYIGGTEAFDLLGNKRCNYNPSTKTTVSPAAKALGAKGGSISSNHP
jgi:hypothetical protein